MTPPPASGRAARAEQVRALIMAGQFSGACELVEPLIRLDPRNPELLALAARANLFLGKHEQAIALATRALAQGPHPEPLMIRGDSLRALGRSDEAAADLARAVQLEPAHPDLRAALAAIYEESGRYAEAAEVLAPTEQLYASAGRAPTAKWHYECAKLRVHAGDFTGAEEHIARGIQKVQAGTVPHLLLLFLRAKARDRAGDYPSAWAAAMEAHTAARLQFDPAERTRQTDEAIAFWTRERMKTLPVSGDPDPLPVFIAGMPRSGTSLVDQIVHAHPRGAGVGELATLEAFAADADAALIAGTPKPGSGRFDAPHYTQVARAYLRHIRGLAPSAHRIVNKALGNDRMLGHLSLLFPGTRIVHIVRDPRDVTVSCVMGAFNTMRSPWVGRPEWVAHVWRESDRLMRHWGEVLQVPILRVRYEDIALQGAPEIRKIIEFTGLPWDDAVMRFHTARRTVRTLSYDQVNRPLYASSVGRWKHYEAELAGVDFPGL